MEYPRLTIGQELPRHPNISTSRDFIWLSWMLSGEFFWNICVLQTSMKITDILRTARHKSKKHDSVIKRGSVPEIWSALAWHLAHCEARRWNRKQITGFGDSCLSGCPAFCLTCFLKHKYIVFGCPHSVFRQRMKTEFGKDFMFSSPDIHAHCLVWSSYRYGLQTYVCDPRAHLTCLPIADRETEWWTFHG